MASLVDYGAALRFVQTRAEALGLGFTGAHPRALYACLKGSLPILSQPCDAFRRPGQIRAHARVLAQCEELMVTVAAALHSRDAADEERAVAEARRLSRLLVEVRPTLGVYDLEQPWPKGGA
jgi:hypothetical protein